MTAKDIANMLASNAESVAKMLLPVGKREGSEWRCGSVDGGEGKSLGVHLTGAKAGVWSDFSSGEAGDLLDLWASSRNITLAAAIRQAKDYLGIEDIGLTNTRKAYRKPEKPKCNKPKSAVKDWLQSRKISEAAIEAYKVSESGDEAVFPYLRDGELITVKYRNVHDKKKMRIEKDCELCLFGWQVISENARSVTICEGEVDALSLWMYGYPALSVPNGANSHTWIENDYDRLEQFDEIFICFDMDDAGRKGVNEVINRLGRERCKVVQLPRKDANECLIHDEDIVSAFNQSKTQDPIELKNASEFVDDVIEQFYPNENAPQGFTMPWDKTHKNIRFRPAEVITILGINGHGKSQFAGHLMLEAMKQGKKVCIFSGELNVKILLGRMVKQAAGFGNPSIPMIRTIHEWLGESLWIFDLVGKAKGERLLEVFSYAKKRYGVEVFLIDSFLKCGIDEDDNNAQKNFMEAICDFKNSTESTVFLVRHPRKGADEYQMPDKMDAKGSGSIEDMADTQLVIFRNKKYEEAIANGEKPEDQAGAYCKCVKQRNGDWENTIWLWFDKESYQYIGKPDYKPLPYVRQLSEAKNG